ncbi:homoserine O-acetyltransferase [Amycolatopsis sp. 195334CR]|uniref:homoserine O-acetyltransferase MetX n=1 Tax=Amycolatopsis sp. 195334CR TaxID=2814588 RepID=UPI001A8C3EB3|nr:homoserine O-acetyltransferase [Amycolatopsis sp. 195334CR]MBN6034450.1 homoserine O-acetyltransferase [Amycolatopsis sp. 195334CR]
MTGAWRPGDPPGRRRWVTRRDAVRLEGGAELPGFSLAYETWGTLNADASNAVLIEHALTGDSHVAGPAEDGHPSAGWWDALVGPGRPLDTDEFFVVAPNVLGGCQGSTGPSSVDASGRALGSRFPALTIRDQVLAETFLADELGIVRWAAVLGGSMGGMRALEWAVGHPSRVAALLVLAAPAAASADQIAWAAPQLHAITGDPHWHGGDYYGTGESPDHGLGIARRIAHVTYRSEPELAQRFGRTGQGDGRFAVESYLDHHAVKLVRRFDAGSYVVLTRSMNSHDVGRDRGGIAAALARVTARTVVAGVDSDRLYPLAQSVELAAGIRGAGEAAVIHSPYGHDSFLIETAQIAALLKPLLT